jgi:hypothetical protein
VSSTRKEAAEVSGGRELVWSFFYFENSPPRIK